LELGDSLKGYGEHPAVEEALRHASEDYLAGRRPYETVYGVLYDHYLTGSSSPSSELDAWVLQGQTFDAWFEDREIVFDLRGYHNTRTPREIIEKLETQNPVIWENRGYTFSTSRMTAPDGSPGAITETTHKPPGDPQGHRAWMYRIAKRGAGPDFIKASEAALKAPAVEVVGD
jgi:hypothetical protein